MARAVDPMRRALPLAEWPGQDKRAWLDAVAEGDILDGRGPAAHWATATKRTNIQHYGRWLGYLRWRGILDGEQAPANRVTPEVMRAYNQHLKDIVAPRTRLSMLVGLKVMMQAMAPEQSWRWLQDVCNRVQRTAEPRTDKRARMRPSNEIYSAAMQELQALPSGPLRLQEAISFRDAFMLALLAARPVRVRNLTSITLGRHLTMIGDRWLLTFPAEETKTHQPIEFFLPDTLMPWLDRYLSEVRQVFSGSATSRALWLTKDGPVRDPHFAYHRIVKLTRRLLGTPINPHLLRDCAASSLAMESADMARAAAPLLGHRHFSTTERYYIQANNLEASRRINDILANLKASLEGVQ